jgi:hypothetical protein
MQVEKVRELCKIGVDMVPEMIYKARKNALERMRCRDEENSYLCIIVDSLN